MLTKKILNIVQRRGGATDISVVMSFFPSPNWFVWRMLGRGVFIPTDMLEAELNLSNFPVKPITVYDETCDGHVKSHLLNGEDCTPSMSGFVKTMWQVSQTGSIQSGGLRPFQKYLLGDSIDEGVYEGTEFAESRGKKQHVSDEVCLYFKSKFGVFTSEETPPLDNVNNTCNGALVERISDSEGGLSSIRNLALRTVNAHLHETRSTFEVIHMDTCTKNDIWFRGLFIEHLLKTPGWDSQPSEWPVGMPYNTFEQLSNTIMRAAATRIAVLWGKEGKYLVYTTREGRRMKLHRISYQTFTYSLKQITVTEVVEGKKTVKKNLEHVWNIGVGHITSYFTETYIPYGGRSSYMTEDPAPDGVLNLFMPNVIPIEHHRQSDWLTRVRAAVERAKEEGIGKYAESVEMLTDVMREMSYQKYQSFTDDVLDDDLMQGFVRQLFTVFDIIQHDICTNDEQKITMFYRKMLCGLVYPKPTPEHQKYMILLIGEKGRGKTAVLRWFKRLYGVGNGTEGKSLEEFLKSQSTFTPTNITQLIIFDETRFPKNLWNEFKEYIKADQLPWMKKFHDQQMIPNSHIVFGTMNDGLPQESTGEKEPPTRRISTFRLGPVRGTQEESAKMYETAFSFPEHLTTDEKTILICFAIDVMNLVFGEDEEVYDELYTSSEADITTIKLFEPSLTGNREISFLHQVVTHKRNTIPSPEHQPPSDVPFAKLPSVAVGLRDIREGPGVIPEDALKLRVHRVNCGPKTINADISLGLNTFYIEEVEGRKGYMEYLLDIDKRGKRKGMDTKVIQLFCMLNRMSARNSDDVMFRITEQPAELNSFTSPKQTRYIFPEFPLLVIKLITSPEYYKSHSIIDMYPVYKYSNASRVSFSASDDTRLFCFKDLLTWYVCFRAWSDGGDLRSIAPMQNIDVVAERHLINRFIEVTHNHAYTAKELSHRFSGKASTVSALAKIQKEIWEKRISEGGEFQHIDINAESFLVDQACFSASGSGVVEITMLTPSDFLLPSKGVRRARENDNDDQPVKKKISFPIK